MSITIMSQNILIIQSEELTCIQKILKQLDASTKLIIIDTLNGFTLNVLSIFDVILTFPIINDIKCFIITMMFTNLGGPIKYYTSVNNKWVPFCISFGKSCNFLLKFDAQELVMNKLMTHFISTKMDKSVNIMCVSKLFAAFILHNDPKYTCAKFTFLTFDRISDKVSMCVFDELTKFDCKSPTPHHNTCPFNVRSFYRHHGPVDLTFELNNMYVCDVIYCPDERIYTLTKTHKNQLINKIIKMLSRINNYCGYKYNQLFY